MDDQPATPVPAAAVLPTESNHHAAGGGKRKHMDTHAGGASSGAGNPHKKGKAQKIPKQKRVGNFRSYYSYRLGQKHQGELEDDPRLAVLDKTWFEGKRGLDIGCNSGEFTIAIARRMSPSFLLGVDVDPQLISRARSHLKDIMQQEKIKKAFDEIPAVQNTVSVATSARNAKTGSSAEASPADVSDTAEEKPSKSSSTAVQAKTKQLRDGDAFANEMPLSFRLWKPPTQGGGGAVPRAIGKASIGTTFPLNVVFKREDVATDAHAGKDYDFITCFSVTKWIHLFHGDEGIKKVFAQIYALLAPGGRLILEPQPWKSYHKRKFTSEVTAANYPKIQLRPKDFPGYLVDTLGFRSCDFLQVCQTSVKGFRRPIYVALK